jgi:hypothetical protein
MEKPKRVKYGLDSVSASVVDVDTSSLFDIFVPKQLRSGKNEIRLRLVNDGLVKGSEVLIDILDQIGNPLYYEIGEIANEDKSRSIVVEIEPNDLSGPAKLYIYAKLSQTSSYLSIINLDVNSELETEQEIKFVDPPEIFYQERKLATQTFTNQSRKVTKVGTGNISTVSPVIPKQLVESTFQVEKKELRTIISQGSTSNNIGSGSSLELPQQFSLARITSQNFPFSSSYIGGEIVLNNISLEVPNDSLTSTPFVNLSYSASILNVISTSSIEVYPPFTKTIEYPSSTGIKTILVDRLFEHSNFTCSFNEVLSLSQTNYTQSYAVFDIYNLDPITGKVASIDVSYKNLSLIGDNYEPLGNFEVRSQNYLIDSNNLTFDNEKGVIERPVGIFKSGILDFQTYWQTSSNVQIERTDSIPDGIKFSGNEITFEPKPQYHLTNRQNQNWKLVFDYELLSSQSLEPQLDVFISGSGINKISETKLPVLTPNQSSALGTYVGSITDRRGNVEIVFNSSDNTRISPKFTLRRGFLSIGNIVLQPEEKVGYNVKQTRIFAPLNIPTGSELNFKFDYVNPVGKKVNKFSSLLPGVYFEGSFKPTSGGGTVTIPPGTVSGSDQLTSSYDNRYERKGTGLLSSSNQIAIDITGSFVSASNSLSSRINIFETKTLYSSSQQVDYNLIVNRPTVSGSSLYRLLISSGSNSSSSYADSRLTYDTSQSKFSVTGSTNLNGNLYQTGSTSTRMSYIWSGPITVGTTPGIEWTNMQNSVNTWLGTGGIPTPDATYIGDFAEITQGRLFTSLQTIAAGPTCSLEVQYSLDGSSSWDQMVTLTVGNSPNYKDSGWARIPNASKTFCYIRLVGWGGDGLRDPRFSPPIVLFR